MNFNEVNCFIDSTNTGFGRCTPRPGKLEYEIAVPKGLTITNADIEDIRSYLDDLLTDDDPTARGYKLGKYVKVDDSSADDVRESFDGGVETTLYDGAYIWMRRQIAGAMCAQKAFRKFNGTQDQFDWLLVFRSTDPSAKFYVAGKRVWNSTTGVYDMRGVSYDDIWSPKWKAATGNTSAEYKLRTVMGDVTQINEDFMFIPVDFDVADLPSVQDVFLTATKASTGNFDILAVNSCDGRNLTEVYPGVLDDATLLICTNDLGNNVSITGVSIVAGKIRAALTVLDADYVAGTSFKFKFAAISVTAAAPFSIEWIESNETKLIAK